MLTILHFIHQIQYNRAPPLPPTMNGVINTVSSYFFIGEGREKAESFTVSEVVVVLLSSFLSLLLSPSAFTRNRWCGISKYLVCPFCGQAINGDPWMIDEHVEEHHEMRKHEFIQYLNTLIRKWLKK